MVEYASSEWARQIEVETRKSRWQACETKTQPRGCIENANALLRMLQIAMRSQIWAFAKGTGLSRTLSRGRETSCKLRLAVVGALLSLLSYSHKAPSQGLSFAVHKLAKTCSGVRKLHMRTDEELPTFSATCVMSESTQF